jgi:hypothetical protein
MEPVLPKLFGETGFFVSHVITTVIDDRIQFTIYSFMRVAFRVVNGKRESSKAQATTLVKLSRKMCVFCLKGAIELFDKVNSVG